MANEINEKKPSNFIREIIDHDLESGKNNNRVHTRFPPEPNGFLHIGHAKAICINYGIAEDYNGKYNLRFDDTNPVKEETKYVESIIKDIKWLGFDWQDRQYFASDYFPRMYELAVELIKLGKAYVCELAGDEIREYRGSLTEPGKNSPYRDRPIEESLELFTKMKNGEFADGSKVLRAKIDMSSSNMNMRDPILYRIVNTPHHRTGDTWHIYPMYDWAHGLEDSFEGITHSLCSLEFENHRPLYNWFLDTLGVYRPQQIEFARLNLNFTVMSKRKLMMLVDENLVSGWDDPRMPTLSGLRRRGFSPESIRSFCEKIGVAKRNSMVDVALLEYSVREHLNDIALRRMAVLNPIKVIIDNYPENEEEFLPAVNNPEDESAGTREIPFSKELYIEHEDFMEVPAAKFWRLFPGNEVRLRYAYYITCTSVDKDENGNITVIHCNYDPETKGGRSEDGRKIKSTLHWVSAKHAVAAEVRQYDRLFTVENPLAEEGEFTDYMNNDSLTIIKNCQLEPCLANTKVGDYIQFERLGYFVVDSEDSSEEHLVFNRTVPLRDNWKKVVKQQRHEKNLARQKAKKKN